MQTQQERIVPTQATFEMRPVSDPDQSDEKGVAALRYVEMVIFRAPGDKHTLVEKEVTPDEIESWKKTPHKQHVVELYRRWKDGLEDPVSGTPLKDWPSIAPGQVHQALMLGIKTVEDFASLSEEGIRNFGFGARELKMKANAYMQYGSDQGKVIEKVAAQQTKLENQETMLQEMMTKMAEMQESLRVKEAALAALTNEDRKKKGAA